MKKAGQPVVMQPGPTPCATDSITLISHASVIIEMGGVHILTDPWQFGTAFNDSWRLIVSPAPLEEYFDRIDYIWISHEHPDHFHIPTLKSFPEDFRQRVTVLFQQSSDHPKMVSALTGMLGFRNVRLMPHRQWITLDHGVEAYSYHSRQIDSALAVRDGHRTVLNLNDCETSERDLANLRSDLGPIDVLLNQFSIAGFDGKEDKLAWQAAEIIDTMVRDHRVLEASTTVPFASFVYFCCPDNVKINRVVNSPPAVAERFAGEGLDLAVLMPGDSVTIGERHDSTQAIARYKDIYRELDSLPLFQSATMSLAELTVAFVTMRQKLILVHGKLGLRMLRPVVVAIPDLATSVVMSFRDGIFTSTSAAPDIEINSQPLHFMLANNFGLQTLGVSGRYRLFGDLGNWFRHRALLAMLNAGIGLSVRKVFSVAQLAFFWRRRGDLANQILYRIRRAMDAT